MKWKSFSCSFFDKNSSANLRIPATGGRNTTYGNIPVYFEGKTAEQKLYLKCMSDACKILQAHL